MNKSPGDHLIRYQSAKDKHNHSINRMTLCLALIALLFIGLCIHGLVSQSSDQVIVSLCFVFYFATLSWFSSTFRVEP